MKCSFCGNEIRLGSIYCEKCGKAAQIVPDYNVLEDDLLARILEDKSDGGKKDSGEKNALPAKKRRWQSLKRMWKNKKARLMFIISAIAIICLIAGGIIGLQNSYSYQYRQGIRQDKAENYEKALSHYLKAIQIDDTELDAKIKAGFVYYELGEYEKAKNLLWPEAENNADQEELYRCLILCCIELQDYTSLEKLQDLAEGENIKNLFDTYLIAAPVFSQEEGEYDDDVELTLSSREGYDIYYTTNKTDPIKNGRKYQEPLILTDGETVVSAVCRNSDGVYGQIEEKTYQVNYDTPEYARVTPMQGTFTQPTYITIESEDGAEIYYTWDGSDPTAASSRYTEPILIPEGNNVLSVLVIDKHGISSDILRCNYKYLP